MRRSSSLYTAGAYGADVAGPMAPPYAAGVIKPDRSRFLIYEARLNGMGAYFCGRSLGKRLPFDRRGSVCRVPAVGGRSFVIAGGLLGFRKLQILRPFHRKIQDLSEVYLATRAGV
jgi:hypothetical protein